MSDTKLEKMSFEEILDSEYRSIVEALEHGCSDKETIQYLKQDLLQKTGYVYL